MKQELSRFLRSEIMGRWQVGPSQVAAIDITRESIVHFLQNTFEFSERRATVEAEELFRTFQEKLHRATRLTSDETPAEDTTSFDISAA
jgi:hypothetical protein